MLITVEAQRETYTPEHAERTQKYAPGFALCVREVMDRAEGRWGWCCVKVTARFKKNGKNYIGTAFLRECSYESERDFILNSGYFESMVKEAINDATEVRHSAESAIDKIKRLLHVE